MRFLMKSSSLPVYVAYSMGGIGLPSTPVAVEAVLPLGAAWGAQGLLVRDLIGTANGPTQEQYDLLTRAWREVVGPLHEDDVDLRSVTA